MEWPEKQAEIQKIDLPLLIEKEVELHVLREDLLHEFISGNKWRKLKYNVLRAEQKKCEAILTFGGAFSNHIAATAAAGKAFQIKTIGIIRGKEADLTNPTLAFALEQGMEIHKVSRTEYHRKYDEDYKYELRQRFGNIHIVPEGGSNYEGINGCTEILKNISLDFDYVTVACGTGATLAGILLSLEDHQKVLGFQALKGEGYLKTEIQKMLKWYLMDESLIEEYVAQWEMEENYHFGGFGKITDELVSFIKDFKKQTGIQLDGLYTGKHLFGVMDKIQKNEFPKGTKVLAIHTGGLQGNQGLEARYGVSFD